MSFSILVAAVLLRENHKSSKTDGPETQGLHNQYTSPFNILDI